MAEIQEAAEIITSAVSPEANIIFGATLKPEIEDELVITVIATGFDSEYFHEDDEAPVHATETTHVVADEEIESVNMDLDTTDSAEHFADETPTDIWKEPDTTNDDDDDTPAFLRRRKKNNPEE